MSNATDIPARRRILLLCMTYGEPATTEFAAQFSYSHSILNRLTRRVAPIPRFVTPLLAARRARIRGRMFREMGYTSPLEPISISQAERIGVRLRELLPGDEIEVRLVMEFRPPFLFDILPVYTRNSPDEIVVLPLYVAESDFTTGVSRTDFATFHRRTRGAHGLPGPAYVDGFGFDERMGKLLAESIASQCRAAGWDEAKCRDSALVLGAHGTLQFPPEGVNSGARETLFLFGLIRKHLKDRFGTVRIAWLNHKLGGKWTFPSVDETGAELQAEGVRRFVYFPFGFFGDNNESQNEGRLALDQLEWDERLYLDCPNDDAAFCDYMALRVVERLANPEREDWSRIDLGGRRDLVQKERPAIAGTPGRFKAGSQVLGGLAVFFWFVAATILFVRGYFVSRLIEGSIDYDVVIISSLLIGYFKGSRILAKVVIKNLRRIRRLPQPSPLHSFFTPRTWAVIAGMIALGIVLRFLEIRPDVYATILWGVGLGLFWGGMAGLLNLQEARPRGIASMRDKASPSAAQRSAGTASRQG